MATIVSRSTLFCHALMFGFWLIDANAAARVAAAFTVAE
jgi:hypothetical protein